MQHHKAASNSKFHFGLKYNLCLHRVLMRCYTHLKISFPSVKLHRNLRPTQFRFGLHVSRHRRGTSKWAEISLRTNIWVRNEISDLPQLDAALVTLIATSWWLGLLEYLEKLKVTWNLKISPKKPGIHHMKASISPGSPEDVLFH